MLINETSKATNLTKKAIEYYIEQGLISPVVLDNGYRDFSESDIECLKKISVLRKLGLTIEEIISVFADETGSVLQKLSVQKQLTIQRLQVKKNILDRLSCSKNYANIASELEAAERNNTITNKLLDAFPGYYGRFICLHFARFLNEPIKTGEQQKAYEEIIEFLDNAPTLSFPEDLQAYLTQCTQHISTTDIIKIVESTKHSMENMDEFLSENQKMLTEYLLYKQSDEYKSSPAYKIQNLLKEFNNASGYYTVFIPAMKKLSASYSAYYRQMEAANKTLIEKYPEIANIND